MLHRKHTLGDASALKRRADNDILGDTSLARKAKAFAAPLAVFMAAFIFVAPARAAVDSFNCYVGGTGWVQCDADINISSSPPPTEVCLYLDGAAYTYDPGSWCSGDISGGSSGGIFGTSSDYCSIEGGTHTWSLRDSSDLGTDLVSGTLDCATNEWTASGGGGGGSFMFSADDATTTFFDIQDALKTFLLIAIPTILGGLVILRWIFRLYGKVRKGR